VLVEPKEFVIAEGLLPLHTRLARACFDVTVYLDPPEDIRRRWKVARDTSKRGYEPEQVLDELIRREPESAAYIRPQRSHADIVVRFSPIAERGETIDDPLSAYVLLRPTIAHPDLSGVTGEDTREAMHLKLMRDEDGKPVDAWHIHAYANRELTGRVEQAMWRGLHVPEPVPDTLGELNPGDRSEPLALVQLRLTAGYSIAWWFAGAIVAVIAVPDLYRLVLSMVTGVGNLFKVTPAEPATYIVLPK